MTDFGTLLRLLVAGEVEFVVVGGMAAVAHGSAHVTADLDIVYARSPGTVGRLADALRPIGPPSEAQSTPVPDHHVRDHRIAGLRA